MPLKQIATSESTSAELVAQRCIAELVQAASKIKHLRVTGIPATDARPATQLPNGQVQPGRPATPAVSAEAINAAFGAANIEALDAVDEALGL